MKKEKWIWMAHAGHFILSKECQFKLNTYVGKYIVSTIGELWTDRSSRRVLAHIYNPKWYKENQDLKGDDFDSEYFKQFGFEEVGVGIKYETMVFKAKKSKHECCPYVMKTPNELDFMGYDTPEDATKGHMKMCKKWSKK